MSSKIDFTSNSDLVAGSSSTWSSFLPTQVSNSITTNTPTTVKPKSVNYTPTTLTSIVSSLDPNESFDSGGKGEVEGEIGDDGDCKVAATSNQEDPLATDSNVQSPVLVAVPPSAAPTTTFLEDKLVSVDDQISRRPIAKQINSDSTNKNDQKVDVNSSSTVSYDEAVTGEVDDGDLDEIPTTKQQLLSTIDDEENSNGDETLSKRAFLINRGSSISEELRKLKNKQRAKLFPKRKKGKKKLKSTQTRQSSVTTASYGNLTPTDQYVHLIRQLKLHQQQQQQQQAYRQPSFVSASINPISSTLRQHFPSFATNTQQLSSTVQKLIMGKLSPQQTSGTRQSGRLVPLQLQLGHNNNNDHLQTTGLYPSIVSAHSSNGGETLTYTKSTNPLNGSNRLNEVLHQWASSDESPIYASSGSLLKQAIKQQQQQQVHSNKNKMIPIEIIGLDPAVTNSIMYGSNESLRGNSHSTTTASDSSPVSNGEDMDHSKHYEHGIYQATSIRGPHVAVKTYEQKPKAPSILHIHHFHTQAKPNTPTITQHQRQIGNGADASSAEQQEVVVSGGGQGSAADNLLHVIQQPGQQHMAYQQPDRAYRNGQQVPQNQQVYVNDRGQLVYLSVEDQNSTSILAQSRPADSQQEPQQVEPQSGENQDQASWQTVGLQVEPPTNGQDQQTIQENFQQQNPEYTSPEGQNSESQQQADAQEQQQQQDQQVEGNMQQLTDPSLNSSQINGGSQLESGNNHNGGIPMVQRQIQPQQSPIAGDPTKQTRQVFLTTNDDQTIGMIGRGNGAQHESQNSGTSDSSLNNSKQQFLMVSYKPKPQQYQSLPPNSSSLIPFQQQNITSIYPASVNDDPYGASTNTRSPYNEGQESKPSFVSANSYPGQQLFKSANILLKPFASNIAHISQSNINHPFISSANNNELSAYGNNGGDIALARYRPLNVTDSLSQIILDDQNRAIRTNHTNPMLQLPSRYQENRVPSSSSSSLSPLIGHPALKSLLITSERLNNNNPASSTMFNNNTRNVQVDLGNVPGTWLSPLGEQFNDHKFFSNQTNQQSTNNLVENVPLYKQLQRIRDELLLQQQLQQQQANQQTIQLKTFINNPNNTTRVLPHGELLSLLHDLKLYNLTNGSNLVGQNNINPNSNSPFNVTYVDSNLATAIRPNLNRHNSKQNHPPLKFINNLANNNNNSNLSQQQNGFANNNLKLAHNIKQQDGIGDSLMPIRSLQPIRTTQPTVQDYSEFDDTSGLSNLALAFIFIISLVTLAIIAVSMFYRHRRRSSGRCTDLPAQSARKLTRNLTKRTKHFVRSNFITPNHDITSIKSINLDTSASTSVRSPNSSASNCQDVIGETKSSNQIVNNSNHRNVSGVDDANIGGYLSKKAFGQTLSSFANSTPISEKYQFTTTQSEDSAADIKTLNTRLQKASYLKSLISAPESLLSGCKKLHTPQNRACESSDGGGAYYLNVKNLSNNLGNGKQALQQIQQQQQQLKPRSPTEYSCRLSNSSKKPTCDSTKNHGSSSKDYTSNCGISSSSCDKHSEGKNYSKKSTMSTIQSVSDCDSKSSVSNVINSNAINSPNQIKRQSNFVCNFGKFNNLPAPKHLVASSFPGTEDRTNRGSSSDNHSQIDKL